MINNKYFNNSILVMQSLEQELENQKDFEDSYLPTAIYYSRKEDNEKKNRLSNMCLINDGKNHFM